MSRPVSRLSRLCTHTMSTTSFDSLSTVTTAPTSAMSRTVTQEEFEPTEHPHRRCECCWQRVKDGVLTPVNPLTGKHVLVSPHRTKRPWNGQTEAPVRTTLPEYDEKCYLCPGNHRMGGATNPQYTETFVSAVRRGRAMATATAMATR